MPGDTDDDFFGLPSVGSPECRAAVEARHKDWTPRAGTVSNPLPSLEWPGDDKPSSWYGINPKGQLTKVYRSYEDYCDD